jgi:hypothetical protein
VADLDFRRVFLLAVGVACGSGCGPVTGPNDVQRIEGAFCEPGKPDEVILEGEDWRVTMYYNWSEVRDVVEDGVHRFVEFRGCGSTTCIIDGESADTGEDAIESCRESTNIPKPLRGIRESIPPPIP